MTRTLASCSSPVSLIGSTTFLTLELWRIRRFSPQTTSTLYSLLGNFMGTSPAFPREPSYQQRWQAQLTRCGARGHVTALLPCQAFSAWVTPAPFPPSENQVGEFTTQGRSI